MDCHFYRIALTKEDKKKAKKEWETKLKEISCLKEDFDYYKDNEYHHRFVEKLNRKIKEIDLSLRPDFMEKI